MLTFVAKCDTIKLPRKVARRKKGVRTGMTIAEKLLKARGNKKRADVAKDIGISLSAISMYETGARVPRDEVKVKLAEYYGVSVQELFFNN